MTSSRRQFLAAAPLALASALVLGGTAARQKARTERVIRIEARRFRFAPDAITLKAGETVVLELSALDFTHGFSIPDWHMRTDLVVGKVVRMRLTPAHAGTFSFLCDNFCGSGHEEMGGTIVVQA